MTLLGRLAKKFEREWPVKTVVSKIEPRFIFLLTPPNSGSTAIAQTFMSCQNVAGLKDNGEGQWLIKGLSDSDRWSDAKQINKKSLRSVWMDTFNHLHENNQITHIIEKSPPNMVRIDILKETFPQHIVIASNRDPYANVSSKLFRYTSGLEGLSTNDRHRRVLQLTEQWVKHSTLLRHQIVKHNIPYLSYEDFCADPTSLQGLIDKSRFSGEINLDFSGLVKVKDYCPQGIMDFNSKQKSNLRHEDFSAITDILKPHEGLLSFFNYETLVDSRDV